MKRGINKRGLSPVIATILLIFLVLVLAAIFALWARGFFSEQLEKAGESVENQCARVSFRADIRSFSSNRLVIDITNNGNVDLYGINIRYPRVGRGHATETAAINLEAGRSTYVEISISGESPDFSEGNEVTIYPVLLATVVGGSENKEYTCVDSGERFRLRIS